MLRCSKPPPNAIEFKTWCVDGLYQIYMDSLILNKNDKMARLMIEDCHILICILHTAPIIKGSSIDTCFSGWNDPIRLQ